MEEHRAAGAWNMAADREMMDLAAAEDALFFRLYRWSSPTLSLGYFQRVADRRVHLPSTECEMVRRPTGGGAILHDREWTYALAIPKRHPLARDRLGLYRDVHLGLIASLQEVFGVEAHLCSHCNGSTSANGPCRSRTLPFLCFRRHSPGDVLLLSEKIAGSAQYRTDRAVLQHGSLVWGTSRFAPEIPGIEELLGRTFSETELHRWRERWRVVLAHRWQVAWEDRAFSPKEERGIRTFEEEVFRSQKWNARR